MSYDYKEQRKEIFKEENQVMFLKIRDRAFRLIETAGVAQLGKIITGISGDAWTMMACIDRLVELRELKEVPQRADYVAGQDRIFTK